MLNLCSNCLRRGQKNLSPTNKRRRYEPSYICCGISTKDGYIKKAVNLIRSTKTNYRYWVEKAPDQNGNMSFIIYFDFKLDGERYQISFHSFNKSWESYLSSGRKTRWDKRIGGSAYAAKMLIDYYDL